MFMNQLAGSYNQPFTLRPHQIWKQLDTRHRAVLKIVYELDNTIECLEYHRLKQEGCCRPSDDWRWLPMTSLTNDEAAPLQRHLHEAGINEQEALTLVRSLEARGLLRCHQDRWAKDDRLFVRILFLGQRVVRDAIPGD